MSEKQIVNTIRTMLESRGFWVLKIHGSPLQVSGLPDLLAIKDGLAHWFEVKTPKGTLSKLQRYWIDKLIAYGCVAGVVRSVEDVERVLSKEVEINKD